MRERLARFVAEIVIPAEERDVSTHGLDDGLRAEVQYEARTAGVFAPQVAHELGGLGLDHRAQAVIFEQAGYSILGPQALNCAAPDEGNMDLLAARRCAPVPDLRRSDRDAQVGDRAPRAPRPRAGQQRTELTRRRPRRAAALGRRTSA